MKQAQLRGNDFGAAIINNNRYGVGTMLTVLKICTLVGPRLV